MNPFRNKTHTAYYKYQLKVNIQTIHMILGTKKHLDTMEGK